MCMVKAPRAPTPTAPAPAPRLPEAPTPPPTGSRMTGDADRRRRARSNPDAGGTLLTGPRGVTDAAPTAMKTLLGQ